MVALAILAESVFIATKFKKLFIVILSNRRTVSCTKKYSPYPLYCC